IQCASLPHHLPRPKIPPIPPPARTRPPRVPAAALLLGFLFPAAAIAAPQCSRSPLTETPPAGNLRGDNDLFGGENQDQGYTNGAVITLVSPNLADYTDDPCLPRPARWINRYLERLHPGRFEQQNMVFSISQSLYTPTDYSRADLIPDDRPYAAILMASFGYNARSGDSLRTTQLQLGVIGPAALGKQVQRAVHHVFDGEDFRGWDNQLHNEPLLGIVHERMHRWGDSEGNAGGWGWDAIAHYGGALGNRATYVNTGLELRWGWRLPDDFGSTPLRPAGENTAPARERLSGWSWHVFATSDVRAVAR